MALAGHIQISRPAVMKPLARHWGALLALALFLAAGLAALDDYGVHSDAAAQRRSVEANLNYLASGDLPAFLSALYADLDKFYGMAFEAALLPAERAFRIEDLRRIHLTRHLHAHLFFLIGGLFAYLLALRLLGSRLLALFALLLFLLHPRLYGHSFFNVKDIPFLAMFAVALFLTHRALKRDGVAAFALLGAAVGVLVNLRLMGLILVAAVLALRTLDFTLAQGWAERKRILVAAGAFALASALTIFALMPYLWGDPLARAVEWWATLSNHPRVLRELFMGTLYRSDDFPAEYLPVWISITTPPFALLLGLIGAAAIAAKCAAAPRKAMRSRRLRFALLLAGCFALPILFIMLPGGNIYNGWRQVYFLWAPFSLLAAFGLQWLASAPPRKRLRAAPYGAVGAGLAAAVISAGLLHPNEQAYFNFLVDRVKPERLRTQYAMDYWDQSIRQPLEWIASRSLLDQGGPFFLTGNNALMVQANAQALPEPARERLANAPPFDVISSASPLAWSRPERALHQAQIYGNTIWTVESRDGLRAIYEAIREREPLIDDVFDVHRIEGGLALVMEPCAPSFVEKGEVTVRAFPVDLADLPAWRQGATSETNTFLLDRHGAHFDGKCVAFMLLPIYPVADFALHWRPEPLGAAEARAQARAALDEGRLLSRAAGPAAYDVYLSDDELAYLNDSCDPLATEHPFHLNVFPERIDDLPEERRALGYERFDFEFHRTGAFVDGGCAAFFPLPDYAVAGVQTGQRREDGGEDLWRAENAANPERRWAQAMAGASPAPAARSVFDVHVADGALVYAKEPCSQADTEARFFLHVAPERTEDLPESRRGSGFANLDFAFFLNGALFEGKCAVRAALPDYPVASIRTGQFAGGREVWRAEFAVPSARE